MKSKADSDQKRDDLDLFVRGLAAVMEAEGHKNAPLAEKAGLNQSTIRDLFRNTSSPKISNALKIAEALGRTLDEMIAIGRGEISASEHSNGTVAVPGKVGAGAHVDLCDDFAKGDGLYHVTCPPQISCHGVVAVEVEGDSMEPVYSPGDILFFSRATHEGVPTEAIGKKVVAETEDGKVWVKLLRPGTEPGLFHLLSINPTGTNMHDIKLKWASPVRMHLPAELVTRVK